ncbi:protein ABHD15 [Esox lucius]|uniref:Serine aminopeptidase S33 domain-containing protein n=1 Tax=Esox lucius TaxID=8010 RepID=A0A3P8XJL8_ESOLU|nr:protein ABHD15 [Esox lucius]
MSCDHDVISSGVWDYDGIFCFLPFMLLVLVSLALRCPLVERRARLAVRAVAWGLWVFLCWLLELPIHHPETEPGRAKGREASRGSLSWGWSEAGEGYGLSPDPRASSKSIQAPFLACKPTALARFLFQHCGSLVSPRLALWPRGDPHLQTISSLLWGGLTEGDPGPKEVTFTRDHLLLKDGGLVALDWAVRREGVKEHHAGGKALGCHTSSPPVLLLIPHYRGGVTPHLRRLCGLALGQGFYALVFHRRGTAGCPLTTPRLTEYGDPADLVQTVTYVRSRHPSSVLLAVSEGSGSGLLLSYLGECGSSSYLTAAACISPVLKAQMWFDTPLPPLYRWGDLLHRKLQLSRYASAFRGVLEVDRALSCSSLRDFEEALFCFPPNPQLPNTSDPNATRKQEAVPGAKTVTTSLTSTFSPGLPATRRGTTENHQHTPAVLHPPGASARDAGAPAPASGARPGANASTPLPRGPPGVGEVASWVPGERGHPARDWETYWERNEPLRDADEVAVPVLCLCSCDDPLLPPPSTLPLALFQNNPYFLLALTGSGGHCGFGLEEGGEEEGGCWSHAAVLEYFQVVAEFLRGEGGPRVAGCYGPERGSQRGLTGNPRKKRATTMRRNGHHTLSHREDVVEGRAFTWQRSYTR